MLLKEIFEKEIDRDIQGVIIVGQNEAENMAQELDEYVVTKELQKHFANFFSAYKKGIIGTTPKMGVWISGFFGSGKSHFLKILSYLLANKSVGDKKAIDYFVGNNFTGSKPKIADERVLVDMKLAADINTDVVLFNIDSKSDSNSKQNKDTIVNVFLKVFNEMQGFCGAMPFLADLERKLTEEHYNEFKEGFKELYGEAWENSRQDFDFIQDDVVNVLTEMGFMSEAAARNWCEKATEPYQISIEDFAKHVKTYIERKGNNHHIVLFFDNYFERQVYEILEMFDIGKFILSTNHKKKMEDKIIRNSPEKLYSILKKYIAGKVTDNEKQIIESIIIKLKPENLKVVSQMDENICMVLVKMNSNFLLSKEIWEQSKDFQRALIYCCDSQLPDEKVKKLIKLILYNDVQNVSIDLYNVFGTKIIKLFYDIMGQNIKLNDNKLHDWTYVLLKDQKLLVRELKKISSKEQRKYLFLQLDLDSKDLLEEIDSQLWEEIYNDIFKGESNDDEREHLAIKFFKIIFGTSNRFSDDFVQNAVGEVYQKLENNQLPFDYWMQIEYLLPSVEIRYSWDKCLRVRKALEQRGYKLY